MWRCFRGRSQSRGTSVSDDNLRTEGNNWAAHPLRIFCRHGAKRCNYCQCWSYMGGGVGCISPQCQEDMRNRFMSFDPPDGSKGNTPAIIWPQAVREDGSSVEAYLPVKRKKKKQGESAEEAGWETNSAVFGT